MTHADGPTILIFLLHSRPHASRADRWWCKWTRLWLHQCQLCGRTHFITKCVCVCLLL